MVFHDRPATLDILSHDVGRSPRSGTSAKGMGSSTPVPAENSNGV